MARYGRQEANGQMRRRKRRQRRRWGQLTRRERIQWLAPYVILILGFAILAKPIATSMYDSWLAQQKISVMESDFDEMQEKERVALIDQAQAYNKALISGDSGIEDMLPYEKQLAYGHTDMMAHLSIPSLSLELPVYHDTDEKTLMIGVGHLKGTGLPVGTRGSRCVLAGHSGMPNARMFDDIGLLKEGDRMVIWSLGLPLAYEVIEMKTVTPDQTEELLPVPGEDLVTLVTCVPYGVNSHRLLVTGRRCEYIPDEEVMHPVEIYVNRRTIPLLVAAFIVLAVSFSGMIARHVVFRRRRQQEEAEEAGSAGDDGHAGSGGDGGRAAPDGSGP